MKQTILMAVVLSSAAVLSGCAVDSAGYNGSDDQYSAGYTGYTVSNQDYGISNGYGPAFWSPRYYYYTGYNHGYGGRAYYGHGRSYGGGYARGGHGGGYYR